MQRFLDGEFDTLYIPFKCLTMLLISRKDQKIVAAEDFDDEPEVLESVEVCLLLHVSLLDETSKLSIHGPNH